MGCATATTPTGPTPPTEVSPTDSPATVAEDTDMSDAVAGDAEPADVDGITSAHNAVRRPLGLPDLIYDQTLAEAAAYWGDILADRGCDLEHNYDSPLGENLYWTSGTAGSFEVVASWASEVEDYNYDANTCRRGRMCGHYTQIVWRDTTHVGCAISSCGAAGEIWMCTYDPAGNWDGEWPY
jgi:uncharacterized protein YkwD